MTSVLTSHEATRAFHKQVADTKTPCTDKTNDPGWWFGDSEDPEEKYNNAEQHRAQELCKECPLTWECLNFALAYNEQYGVWGGATPAQRDLMRRRGRRGVL